MTALLLVAMSQPVRWALSSREQPFDQLRQLCTWPDVSGHRHGPQAGNLCE